MIHRREISRLAILVVVAATTSVFAFQCPEDTKCECIPSYNGLEISCPMANGSSIKVIIRPNQYIRIVCDKSPSWPDFRLNVASSERNEVRTMWFQMCELPPGNISLGGITQMLGAVGVEKLKFESFKDLNVTLKKHHLDGLDDLKYLIFINNKLSDLDEDLLADMPHLQEFHLLENNIHLPVGFFNYTPDLLRLELSDNKLETIKLGTFDNLKKLTFLNLWKNDFTELQSGIFDELAALRTLDINRNNLVSLPEDIFAKLKNLETINLSRNNYAWLPKDLLRNNTKLRVVNMYDNRGNMTTLRNGFFGNLTELGTLRLEWNKFATLPEDLLWGSPSLVNITLTRNHLKTLPALIFRDSRKLTRLELSFNRLENLPDYIFSYTNELIKLDLSANLFTSISEDLFTGLHKLEELNMERNQLTTISDRGFRFLESLKIARFSNNRLTLKSTFEYRDEFGAKSPFHDCSSLEQLHLANNNISEMYNDWTVSMTKLQKLDLKYNDISFISAYDLQFLSNKITVDLTHNKIRHISLLYAEELARNQDTPRDVIIRVENNPMVCSCGLYDFLRYVEGRMHPNVQNYFHIIPGNLTCHEPAWLRNVNVTSLKSKTLTCMARDTNLNITCPEQCDCIVRPEDKAFIGDCSRKNLIHVPNLSDPGNSMRVELNFSGNMLTRMPDLKGMGLESVRKLDLSHNNISEISLNGLSNTIQILQLHNNNISRISPNVLEFLKNSTNLTRLTLHGNRWECDCDAQDFLNFIRAKFVSIPELLQVTCRDGNRSISEMTRADFCPAEIQLIVGISVAIAFTGLLLGVFGLYYRYQQQIKVWLFAHQWCLWLVTEEELDRDKLYDAFVSYSHKDHDFVVDELVSKLESGLRQFKLCLHYRDWLAGDWIPAQIARSVENSRRTIVVLSPNFLESVWGRMEFRAAHSQALSEGRARVILILYGDIGPTEDLDPELRAYLSMNTYVKWDDPWFWDKLRYALPHPPKKIAGNAAAHKIFENHQLCIRMNGEKKELIYPVIETPPANTTPPADTLKTFICDETSTREKPVATSDERPPEKTGKPNGDIAIVFESDKLVRQPDSLILDSRQCTTIC